MLPGLLTAFVSSFAGTLGFAVLLRAPRRSHLPASLIGACAFSLYWVLTQLGLSEAASIFCGSLAGSVLSQIFSRRMRMIGTIFNTLAIVAFVPGLGLYRCMELMGRGETDAGVGAGVQAMISIAMIALGLGVGTFLFRAFTGKKHEGRGPQRE